MKRDSFFLGRFLFGLEKKRLWLVCVFGREQHTQGGEVRLNETREWKFETRHTQNTPIHQSCVLSGPSFRTLFVGCSLVAHCKLICCVSYAQARRPDEHVMGPEHREKKSAGTALCRSQVVHTGPHWLKLRADL